MENINMNELSSEELRNINGGILGLVLAATAVAVASTAFGYAIGKDLYHAIND